MHLQKLAQVKLGLLQDLHLADHDIVKRVDRVAGLLDVLGNRVGDQLENDVLQLEGVDVASDDVDHLLANGTHLGGLCVAGLLDLMGPLSSEANAEDAQKIAVSGTHIDVSLNERLPLLHH